MSRLSRAQTLNGERRTEYFSDFTNSFSITPVGDQLARTTNVKSVIQALKNLVLTTPGERLFNPEYGCYITSFLFENNISENLKTAENYVRDSINLFEPRVEILSVRITNSDERPHDVYMTLVFRTINNEEPNTVTILLKRVR